MIFKHIQWLIIAALCAVCLWLYASKTEAVSRETRKTQAVQDELDSLKASLLIKERDAFYAALEASRLASAENSRRLTENHNAGTKAAVAIATAQVEGNNEVDPDGLLPLSLTDSLFVQYERICAGGSCGHAESTPVCPEAYAGAEREKGTTKNAAPIGSGA